MPCCGWEKVISLTLNPSPKVSVAQLKRVIKRFGNKVL
jgi:hypothetical protein